MNVTAADLPTGTADRYARLTHMIATDQCVILDGATGTELIKVGGPQPGEEERVWGLTALLDSPQQVESVHRSYIDVGCDVICTSTWGLPTALRDGGQRLSAFAEPVHWMDVARQAVVLARSAARDAGRSDETAVAFSLNGDVDTADGRETIRLLSRAFEEERPDLILVETLSLVRSSTYATVEALLETGLPVWLSFRRCRQGLCGVYGEHWGGPEGDAFGRAARRFEEMGVGRAGHQLHPARPRGRDAVVAARLHRHAAGRVSQPRLPVGRRLAPRAADHRRASTPSWRCAGATRARRSSAAAAGSAPSTWPRRARRWTNTKPGHARPRSLPRRRGGRRRGDRQGRAAASRTHRGREMFPLDMPEIGVDDGRVRPHPGQLPGLEVPRTARASAPTSAASTSAAAPACSPSSWPATAPSTSTPSTSTRRR